jgi:hypothetical protein
MIKLTRAEYLGGHRLRLSFSDGNDGVFDATGMLQQDGSLLAPLRDPSYFKGCFLEFGALCWKNGLELSPAALHRQLQSSGQLSPSRIAA